MLRICEKKNDSNKKKTRMLRAGVDEKRIFSKVFGISEITADYAHRETFYFGKME